MPDRPQRIQLSRAKGWRLPEAAVKVDRATAWGNPFRVGVDGTATRCVELYRTLLGGYLALTVKATPEAQQQARTHVGANLARLRGKPLACWCRMAQPCHADVLLELANAPLRCEATAP